MIVESLDLTTSLGSSSKPRGSFSFMDYGPKGPKGFDPSDPDDPKPY